MARAHRYREPLLGYTDRVSESMSRSESITSHVLLSYLYLLNRIYPWQIVPQPNSKRGIIDFFYLPRESEFNVFVEMKKFRAMDSRRANAASKYLKVPFPKELNKLDRTDGVRLLIVTDLRSIRIHVRQKHWGQTKRAYSLKPIEFETAEECSRAIGDWLQISSGEAFRRVIWDEPENRMHVVYEELRRGKKSRLYKEVYSSWLDEIGSKGWGGWPRRFLKAFEARCQWNNKHVPPNQLAAITNVFRKSATRRLVKEYLEGFGIRFRPGPFTSIFD